MTQIDAAKRLSEILGYFINARINVTPAALILLQQMGLTKGDLETFITKKSFLQNFDNHITVDAMQKEFPVYFNRKNENGSAQSSRNNLATAQLGSKRTEEKNDNDENCEMEMPEELLDSNQNSETITPSNPKLTVVEKNSINNGSTTEPKPKNINPLHEEKTNKLNSEESKAQLGLEISESSEIKTLPKTEAGEIQKNPVGKKPASPIPIPRPIRKKKSDMDILNEDGILEEGEEEAEPEEFAEYADIAMEQGSDPEELERIRAEKRKQWESLQIQSTTSSFHALAADYTEQIQILKDPTGKLFTDGKIEDFLNVQNDKFNQIKQILLKRPEGTGLFDIGYVNRLTQSTNVKFIGMVMDKRLTSNKNYMVKFEDQTGTINALVRQNEQSKEVYNLMEKLLPDHIIIVEGYLSIDTGKKSRIVHVSSIVFPDTKRTNSPNFPTEDIAAVFISDTHFGSKDWQEKVWNRFVDYLNCKIGSPKQLEQAGKIKYLCIAGDLVDGIGVYPNQEKRLNILDIYAQYKEVAAQLAKLPDYISIIISPGDHDSVRKAQPAPAIPREIAPDLYNNSKIKMLGCPAVVSLHGIIATLFHGTSLIDLNMSIPGLKNEDPSATMKELIRARHLVPTYGKKTELAPGESDWLVMDPIPDILHTGHLHKNGFNFYNGILMVNSGCFQGQTDFMKSLGIDPDIGKPTIVNLKGPHLRPYVIDLYEP